MTNPAKTRRTRLDPQTISYVEMMTRDASAYDIGFQADDEAELVEALMRPIRTCAGSRKGVEYFGL